MGAIARAYCEHTYYKQVRTILNCEYYYKVVLIWGVDDYFRAMHAPCKLNSNDWKKKNEWWHFLLRDINFATFSMVCKITTIACF